MNLTTDHEMKKAFQQIIYKARMDGIEEGRYLEKRDSPLERRNLHKVEWIRDENGKMEWVLRVIVVDDTPDDPSSFGMVF